ncbi:MAG: MFS transporter [Pseudomonadota bacterium]
MHGFLFANLRWIGAGFLLTFASSFGQTWFISLFAGEVKATYGLSDGGWGAIYTGATLASAALLFARGGVVDRLSFGRVALLTALAFALAAVGMALSSNLWLLILVVFGLRFCGQGMMGHIAMTAMGRWFQARRGRAVALAGLGHPFGEMVLPPLVVLAIAGFGWRGAWGLAAALLALILAPLLVALLARERVPSGREAEAGEIPGLDGRHWSRAEVLRHPLFRLMLPGMVSTAFIGTVVVFHQIGLAERRGWDRADLALTFSLYAGVSVAAALIGGWAVDRFGPPRLLPVIFLPLGLSLAVIAAGAEIWAWYVGLALMGAAVGLNNTLWGALLPHLWGTRHLGSVRAVTTTAMVIATAVGPGLTGLLIDLGVGFPAQCAAMAVWCGGVAVTFWRLGELRVPTKAV